MIMISNKLKVCVTGAAGQIAYSLLPYILNGSIFGCDKSIALTLLDITPALPALQGVVMELQDGAYSLLEQIIPTDDPLIAFKDCDIIFLVGSLPRKEGMQRKDLLIANANIFETQGKAINEVSKSTVKVLIVGNPANTNALICQHFAPRIPRENFSALTRLDENRARSQVALKVGVSPSMVRNVIVWGNHSNTQYPDADNASLELSDGKEVKLTSVLTDKGWLEGDFIKVVQNRGAAILSARKLSSAMSAAKAIADHMRDWYQGTKPDRDVSMAVYSDGSYGIPAGLFFSFPVQVQKNGTWQIVQKYALNDFAKTKLKITTDELLEEKNEAMNYLQERNV